MNCMFCEFVSGKRKAHLNGLPFKALKETKNTMSFLSFEIPKAEDGHIIVTSKKHFFNLEDVPKLILHELIDHASLVSKVLREKHEGCNILLNDGKTAGQRVFHIHFHIIPRDKRDRIKIEVWKNRKLNKNDFEKLQNKYNRLFREYGVS